METHQCILPEKLNTEGNYRRKKEEIFLINKGSDGNQTGVGRLKVTNIDYNTVAPCLKFTNRSALAKE